MASRRLDLRCVHAPVGQCAAPPRTHGPCCVGWPTGGAARRRGGPVHQDGMGVHLHHRAQLNLCPQSQSSSPLSLQIQNPLKQRRGGVKEPSCRQ